MSRLTVTSRGQVTLRKDVLQHMGLQPGEKLEVEKLLDGRIALRASKPTGKIDGFIGLLAGRTKKAASLEEIQEAAAEGWAGKR